MKNGPSHRQKRFFGSHVLCLKINSKLNFILTLLHVHVKSKCYCMLTVKLSLRIQVLHWLNYKYSLILKELSSSTVTFQLSVERGTFFNAISFCWFYII